MQKATQDKNSIKIDTPLGKDALILTRFVFREALSQLFSVKAEVYGNGQSVSPDELIGKEVTITLELGKKKQRYIHAVVADVTALGTRATKDSAGAEHRDYSLHLVASAWYMQHRVNSRIFRAKNVLKIVEKIAGEHGVKIDVTSKIQGSYPDYDFKVQYEESDLAFVQRLLQQEGIFYYFDHSQSSHKLILADKATAYEPCAESSVKYFNGSLSESHIHHWQRALVMAPGKYVQRGYDLNKPKALPTAEANKGKLVSGHASYEVFNYDAESEFHPRGKSIAGLRLDALQRDIERRKGASNCRTFSIGKTFTLSEHEDKAEAGKQYVLTEVVLTAAIASQTGASKSVEQQISNSFYCVPKEVAYRPQLTIAKPLISGVQSATVTCKGGEEISVDALGRVTVKFHWDRSDITDNESSCPIRVSQNWAGKNWGAFFFPRRDQEVLVEFLNGDPDQPIIIGAVYNSDNMPPYTLPDDKTQSGIKTRSSKGGGAANFNELRFEDKKGEELLYLHAEKDFELQVENNQTDMVGKDRLTTVKGNDTETVNKDRKNTVDGSDTLKVGKKLVINAGDAITIKTGAASISMKSDGSIDIKGVNVTIKGSKVSIN
ncbi:type VI secretion system tip protein TssI/VgrG [Rheinheimera baltica]|uniref:type VI secretion system tip protein TssI/VgrG n=1 Tax=Rheinheimera baltica TaxID=67576 RepID=UPI00273F3128|nr:type VI secretion system tip protein TssI/VgrG [Rheinheimera baltica]MDP5143329.1 type VI secretion system tip protein TssI/VgrG [Rheinheimera baltica]MDP5151163.1 type VI secretion system tip protein TssI/VgrG [Rheinheimera baltica]